MIQILLSGAGGKMGQVISRSVSERVDCRIAAGIDRQSAAVDYPIFEKPSDCDVCCDVIIDFSHPSLLEPLLDYAVSHKIPAVVCTTGLSPEQVDKLKQAADKIPVFFSANMSLGVSLLCELAKKAAKVLGSDFDIEIIEKHHNRKLDAPSGTALMLADAAASSLPYKAEEVFERHSVRQPRRREEIGISSIRGGTIVGEHEVIFAGHDEVFEMKHSALSREVFASGAIAAARFIANVKAPGMYDMDDLLKDVMK